MNKVLFQMNVKGRHLAIAIMVAIFFFATTYTMTYEAGYKKGMLTKQQEAVEYIKKVVEVIRNNYIQLESEDDADNDIIFEFVE